MKKIFSIFIIISLLFSLYACQKSLDRKEEQPVLYTTNIKVTIIDINKNYWFTTTHRYIVSFTVYSEKYDIKETFEEEGSGAFGAPKSYYYQKGDIIEVELRTWIKESTGEIVRRNLCLIN